MNVGEVSSKPSEEVIKTGHEGFPTLSELAMLRAWYAGMSPRAATVQYLQTLTSPGKSSRPLVSDVRQRLVAFATSRHRNDLAQLLGHPAAQRLQKARAVLYAIEILRSLPLPQPLISDDVERWLPPRVVRTLGAHGIRSLADLTVRVPHRKQWWRGIAGLGERSARQIETFFASHPQLTERARALVPELRGELVPLEDFVIPHEVDGSRGAFRAPQATSTLKAANDYQAVQAWLALQEVDATRRAYRKEVERLMLWAIFERGMALTSLSTEDAIAYRAFLRRPAPRSRWIGPSRLRTSSDWRPFQGALAPRSIAYALSVIGTLFRWLMEQRYTLANPFSGITVKGSKRNGPVDTSRVFSEHEWELIRSNADGIEWIGGWSEEAGQRLRFTLDFWYATGLRPSEIAKAMLGDIQFDAQGDSWLHVVGKGSKSGKVSLPLLATGVLDRYLAFRRLPVSRIRWNPTTPLIGNLEQEGSGITASRLGVTMRRFFLYAAERLVDVSPTTAEKLKRASSHWMRHTHATHALGRGVDLTIVRDNLRHASVATTSVYLHADEIKRARQLSGAFPPRA